MRQPRRAGRNHHDRHAAITVVVVDDHEMILQSVVRLLARTLRSSWWAPPHRCSGRRRHQAGQPDVLVIDFHLPDMDARKRFASSARHIAMSRSSQSQDPNGRSALRLHQGRSSAGFARRAIHELRDAIRHAAPDGPSRTRRWRRPEQGPADRALPPIVNLTDGRIVGFEALVRWQHPERGLMYPSRSCPTPKRRGTSKRIDRWIREEAIRQLARLASSVSSESPLWMSVKPIGVRHSRSTAFPVDL